MNNLSAVEAQKISDDDIRRIEQKYDAINRDAEVINANGTPVAKSIRFIQPEDKVVKDYSKLKQIALIRHGEPDLKKTGKFNAAEAKDFLVCYDSVCIIVPEKPFFKLKENEDVAIFSSPLNRALSTANYICGTERNITISKHFREFETKIPTHSKRKLPIKVWTAAARVKWMLGIGQKKSGIESFSQAKKRAKTAANMLDQASHENSKVLLTAHGFLNRYIKKNLQKQGWKIVEDTGNDYFGTTILVKIEDS